MSNSRRRIAALATLLLITDIVAWVATAVLAAQNAAEPADLSSVAYVFSFLIFPIVGWLIAVKLPQNPLGWIYLLFSASGAIGTATEGLAPTLAQAANDGVAVALIQGGGWLYSLGLLLIFGPGVLLFPDGRLPSRRWRLVLWGFAAMMVLSLVLDLFGAAAVCVEPVWEGGVLTGCAMQVDNPLHLPVLAPLHTGLGPVLDPLLAAMVAFALVGLLIRYRRSTGDVRQQIKWVVFIATAGILGLLLLTFARQVLGFTEYDGLDTALLLLFTISLPIVIGIAIFKYRLYDIDRIISRTAAYAIVVGLLTAVYAASVTLAQQLLPFESQLGIVVSTLVVAALFNPLRRRVQHAVDQRFNRSKYDAQGVLDKLSSHLREDVDLELMQSALLHAARETMQPSHLSLWVRGPSSSE